MKIDQKDNSTFEQVWQYVMDNRPSVGKALSSQQNFILSDDSVLSPVVIEEIDVTSINQLNYDMNEFVEAEAIKIHKMPESIKNTVNVSEEYIENFQTDEVSDMDEYSMLTTEEENLLTNQFLNGELTFSEFTQRVDQDIAAEENVNW